MRERHKNTDECFILIKAQPRRSHKYSETVCCAGIGRDGKWRRQYPVPYRVLADAQKFSRWNWISYQYSVSKKDSRWESQKVDQATLSVTGQIKKSERASFINPLIRHSFSDANDRGESLTLLRPKQLELTYKEKSLADLRKEELKHAELANQLSFFDKPIKPLKPCPLQFILEWEDQDGKPRRHTNDDWETSAAYNRFENKYGREKAIKELKCKYEEEYFNKGLVLGFSTHSRRNVTFGDTNQWLLVGLIRLDDDTQSDLFLA